MLAAFSLSKSKFLVQSSLSSPGLLTRCQGLQLFLRARLYSSRTQVVAWKDVITQTSKRRIVYGPRTRTASRYPWVEALFEDRFIQPFIHDTHITLVDNGRAHHYVLFCQNHIHLRLNETLDNIWRGDIVVMRLAGTDKEFINMRLDDAARVDHIVNQSVVHQWFFTVSRSDTVYYRFIHEAHQGGRFRLRRCYQFFKF